MLIDGGEQFKEMLKVFAKRGTLFHCTKRLFLNTILKEGLKPSKPKGITNALDGVYLSVVPFDWMDYVTEQGKYAGLMIEVNVEGFDLYFDHGILELETWEKHPAFVYKGTILKERFVKVSISTEKKPNCFDDITEKVI